MKWLLLTGLVGLGPLILWMKRQISPIFVFLGVVIVLSGIGWAFAALSDFDHTPSELAFAVAMIVLPGVLCAVPSLLAPSSITFDGYFWRFIGGIALGVATFYGMVAILGVAYGGIG